MLHTAACPAQQRGHYQTGREKMALCSSRRQHNMSGRAGRQMGGWVGHYFYTSNNIHGQFLESCFLIYQSTGYIFHHHSAPLLRVSCFNLLKAGCPCFCARCISCAPDGAGELRWYHDSLLTYLLVLLKRARLFLETPCSKSSSK